MRTYLLGATLIVMTIFSSVFAAEGDTTIVTSHLEQLMKFPPGNRDYVNTAVFPDGSVSYRKIWLKYTLGCPSYGCSDWDYDTHVRALQKTGEFDSNLVEDPYFTVDGVDRDSVFIDFDTTWVTFYDSTLKITDSMPSDTVYIQRYLNASAPAVATDSFYAFNTGYFKYYWDTNGVVTDSVFVTGDSLWHQNYHLSWDVFEIVNRVEVARLITPYQTDHYPYSYYFDVTDYAPLLRDTMDISLLFSGWQDGFLATLDFIFIEGTPPRDPKRVLHMYNGSHQYGVSSNPINSWLETKTFAFSGDEKQVAMYFCPTGHGIDGSQGCSEFCEKEYYVNVNGTRRYEQLVWRDDCGLNPIFTQGGTWLFDRANWCPGLPGYKFRHELTDFINFTSSNDFKVDFQSYTTGGGGSTPSYSIDGALITFDDPNFKLDAELIKILAPTDDFFESRHNPICNSPKIRIRNSGSTTLTSLTVTYSFEGGDDFTYEWEGSLAFLEEEDIELPQISWIRTDDIFHVSLSNPNGSADEYDVNDAASANFDVPDEMPGEFQIYYRTNTVSADENNLTIEDLEGNIVYHRYKNEIGNDIFYKDTIQLGQGCYRLKLTDDGKDGISYWYWSQVLGHSSGSLSFRNLGSPTVLKSFEAEFGTEITYEFTVGDLDIVGTPDVKRGTHNVNIYPNPAKDGIFQIEVFNFENHGRSTEIQVFDMMGKLITEHVISFQESVDMLDLSFADKGVYTAIFRTGDQILTKKLIIN